MKVVKRCFVILLVLQTYLAKLYINNNATLLLKKEKRCIIHYDKQYIDQVRLKSNFTMVTDKTFQHLLSLCFKKFYHTNNPLTFPGSKWCGISSIASNLTDFGDYVNEDLCCRNHDLCGRFLLPNECNSNVCNKSFFTMSHCECDSKLLKCLTKVGTLRSNIIAYLYTSFIRQCFKEDFLGNNTQINVYKVSYDATRAMIKLILKSFVNADNYFGTWDQNPVFVIKKMK